MILCKIDLLTQNNYNQKILSQSNSIFRNIFDDLSFIFSIGIKYLPKRTTRLMSYTSAQDIIYQRLLERINQSPQKDTNIIVELNPPRMNIRLNRPKRYNSFTIDMYITLAKLIESAEHEDTIKFIVIMGEGGNFSSGNDLTNFTNPIIADLGSQEDILKSVSRVLKQLTETIIQSKKPIIALTEGKVIGFAFTMLALFDKVFAVQTSSFVAPLVSSAQGPQLCSSYTFPKIFGKSIAQQLVTFGKIVNPQFLQKFQFVQKCTSRQDAQKKLHAYLNKIDELEWQSYLNARRLYKERKEKILIEVNQRQLDNLLQRWMNPNMISYLAKHLEKMKQLKSSAKL